MARSGCAFLGVLLFLLPTAPAFRSRAHSHVRQTHSQWTTIPSVSSASSASTANIDPSSTGTVFSTASPAEVFVVKDLVAALRVALSGDQRKLEELVGAGDGAKWDNPFVSNFGELKKSLAQFSGFFSEPSLTVFGTRLVLDGKVVELDYQLSFWWPLPWRPRIIIPAKALVAVTSTGGKKMTISSVVETWQPSLLDIFTRQLLPRFWDVWHLFASTVPEYPPVRSLGRTGKVSFVETPPTIVFEARWSGLAKYPGPPLLTLPGFSFVGVLQTSKPNREMYYPVLPVETLSDSYLDASTGQEMKRTSWIVPVPSAFHSLAEQWVQQQGAVPEAVMTSQVDLGPLSSSPSDQELEDETSPPATTAAAAAAEQDPSDATDFKVVDLNKINLMKSVTNGAVRGAGLRFDETKVKEFLAAEKTEVLHRVLPRRVLAQVELKGEATPARISQAIGDIRAACNSVSGQGQGQGQGQEEGSASLSGLNTLGRGPPLRMKKRSLDSYSNPDYSPQVGLLVDNCKACFNGRGQLAMAAYEIQFGLKRTIVQVELIPSEL